MEKSIIDEKLKKLHECLGKKDKESLEYVEETKKWALENICPEIRDAFTEFADNFLTETENEIKSMREELGKEDYSLLPISYIAKNYFNKSTAWLQQRINGYKVRGKVYTLNEEQKVVFNNAIQDIAKRIGSIHYA